jgi:hypothetical protein
MVVHKEAVEVVQAVHSTKDAAAPIVVHLGVAVAHKEVVEVVQAVHKEVAHKEIEAAAPNLAAEVGLDHKTWIIPPFRFEIDSN